MLSVYIGKHEDEIYNPPIYFNESSQYVSWERFFTDVLV